MRKISAIIFFFILVVSASIALAFITPEEAARHIGERQTVCGTVVSAHYAYNLNGQPTFLNLDQPYPNQIFTIVIWGDNRDKFKTPPETLEGQKICVTGKIKNYRGGPQIIVSKPSQIRISQ